MNQIELTAEAREKTGKGSCHKLRRSGLIPAIFYGKETTPQPISLDCQTMNRRLGSARGENVIFSLTIKGKDGSTANKLAIIKEIQTEPTTREIIHTDFYEVAMDKEIVVHVPVSTKGKAKGVELGGILQMATREIEIECLPGDIPETIVVDVSGLDITESIHVKDLPPSDKYKILEDPEQPLVSVVPPASEEAVAPTAGAAAEPEVLTAKAKATE